MSVFTRIDALAQPLHLISSQLLSVHVNDSTFATPPQDQVGSCVRIVRANPIPPSRSSFRGLVVWIPTSTFQAVLTVQRMFLPRLFQHCRQALIPSYCLLPRPVS